MKALKIITFFLFEAATLVAFAQPKTISGYIFVDENRNGIFDKNEKGLENVSVSNSVDVVQTDKKGRYTLPLFGEATVFVIKPSGYLPRLSEDNIPQAHAFNKPDGSPAYIGNGIAPVQLPASLDFPLYPNKNEDKLKIGLLGDTQTNYKDDVFYVGKLVVDQLIDEQFDFIVPLGDLVNDKLHLAEPLRHTLGKTGSAVYPVMGNHDRNYEAKNLRYRDETFKKVFGPSYYAFNYGANAFIVLNDIYPDTTGISRSYIGQIDNSQMKFVKNYLATLDAKTPVYLFMHIPLEQMKNLKEFLSLFENHSNVTTYAGHTHTQYTLNLTTKDGWPHSKPLTSVVVGAVCGNWWHGEKDFFGVPASTMQDGTPKGYWVMNIEGNSKPTFEFKISGNVPNAQMHIWTPYQFEFEKVWPENREIVANVYAGGENTKVEIRIEGQNEWQLMEKTEALDPYFARITGLRKLDIPTKENIRAYGAESKNKSSHLWKFPIPAGLNKGVYVLEIRATNDQWLNAKAKSLLFVE